MPDSHLSSLRVGPPGGPYAFPALLNRLRFTGTGVPQLITLKDTTLLISVLACPGDTAGAAIAVTISIGTTPGGTEIFSGNLQVNDLKNIGWQLLPGTTVYVQCNNVASEAAPVNIWLLHSQ